MKELVSNMLGYWKYQVDHDKCTPEELRRYADIGVRELSSGQLDTGLTYSNSMRRQTVMVVGKSSSAAEFFNSLLHELKHVEAHITKAFGLNPVGENIAYLCGELGREIYPKVSHLLCDCCRSS